jgi:hypothetical protein
MAKYCIEKFENGTREMKVYWDCPKHEHNAGMITAVAQWLDQNQPPAGWTVRANSFQSNQSAAPTGSGAIEYE